MRRMAVVLLVLAASGAFIGARAAWAHNTSTHRLVNRRAVDVSQLDAVLRHELGLPEGRGKRFEKNQKHGTPAEWLGDGGVTEDDGTRFFSHFHDPLKTWSDAGLNYLSRQHHSSIRWMFEPTNAWSWPAARDYYRLALTAAEPEQRDEAFADTFRAIGQVTHLIVDAAVPEHTRNDAHPGGTVCNWLREYHIPCLGNYEYYVSDLHEKGPEEDFIDHFLSNPAGFDPALLASQPVDPLLASPVPHLIDSDRYDGTNPNVTTSGPSGIAEVSNANFFSEDTGGSDTAYPFPDRTRLELVPGIAPARPVVRYYYRKGAGDGMAVPVSLAECVLDEMVRGEAVGVPQRFACVDANVWAATASTMLPRALDYTRGAINYFFRSRLEVRLAPHPELPGSMAAILTNRSGETLGPGVLSAHGEDAAGRRSELGRTLIGDAGVPDGQDLPVVAVRTESLGNTLVFVFEGTLGLESGAVVGRVVKPVRAVEQIFRGATDWMLRTAEGIFPLGLGLGSSPEAVKWGERDNTFFIQRYEPANNWDLDIRSYRINRPEGDSTVPLTAEGTVDIVETGSAWLSGPAIDLDTRVTFSRLERLTQQQVVLIGRQRSESPEEYNYSLDDVFSFDLGEYVPPPEVPASASLAFEFPYMTNGLANWYGERISLNRDGDILATLQVGLTYSWNSTPVGCRHYGRDFQDFDCSFHAWHELPRPRSLAYVVNLTDRTLVAKSTGDAIGISYTTDSDRWNVDVRLFNFDGEETGLNRALVGFGDPGAPVVAEATIAEHITELTMNGLHNPAFAAAGFSEHAYVSGAFTRDVPVDTRFYNDFSIRLTTQRRYLCPNFTVIEGIEAARGSGGQYLALGQMDCYDDSPIGFRPVLWDAAAGTVTAFAPLDVPRVGYDSAVWPTLLGANRAAALFTVDSFESPPVAYLVTQERAIPLPAGVEAEDLRLLEAGVIVNVRTLQIVHPDEYLTPIRSLSPLADGGPIAGEYHLIGVQ